MEEQHPIPSMGAVIVEDGRILLIERGGGSYAGSWAVPGGRQRLGETMDETVRREVLEETGLVVEVGDPVWVGDIIGDGSHYTVVDFAAFVVGGALVAGDDAADARWVPLSEARDLPLTPTMVVMLDELGY